MYNLSVTDGWNKAGCRKASGTIKLSFLDTVVINMRKQKIKLKKENY